MEKENVYVSDSMELLREWDFEKNTGLYYPDEIKLTDNVQPVNWKCSTCGFKWVTTAYSRYRNKTKCRKCSDKKRRLKIGINDLASQRPDLLEEWDYEKNMIYGTPEDITVGNTTVPINWKCSVCGHKWVAYVYTRAHLKTGCPECAKIRISEGNRIRNSRAERRLAQMYPEIAEEWHPTKNGNMDVDTVCYGSNKSIWWRCSICGDEYRDTIVARTCKQITGCPTCKKFLRASFSDQAIYYYIKNQFPETRNHYSELFDDNTELLAFIPELRIGVDYERGDWQRKAHTEKKIQKYNICKEHGITLITVVENCRDDSQDQPSCDYEIWRKDSTVTGLVSVLKAIFAILAPDSTMAFNVREDIKEIKRCYMSSIRERSLLATNPEFCDEWHPTKNRLLSPAMVSDKTEARVWWICRYCGHEYYESPLKRVSRTYDGCPVCSGKVAVPGVNDFASLHPVLALEWHPTLNERMSPYGILPTYNRKVWWKCSTCGDNYYCTPNKRVTKKQGCPQCSKKAKSKV